MKTGQIVAWAVVDPETNKIILICESRARARFLAGHDARIAKVVVSK